MEIEENLRTMSINQLRDLNKDEEKIIEGLRTYYEKPYYYTDQETIESIVNYCEIFQEQIVNIIHCSASKPMVLLNLPLELGCWYKTGLVGNKLTELERLKKAQYWYSRCPFGSKVVFAQNGNAEKNLEEIREKIENIEQKALKQEQEIGALIKSFSTSIKVNKLESYNKDVIQNQLIFRKAKDCNTIQHSSSKDEISKNHEQLMFMNSQILTQDIEKNEHSTETERAIYPKSLSGWGNDVKTPKKLTINVSKAIPNSAPSKLLSLKIERETTTQPKKLDFHDVDGESLRKVALFRGIHYVKNLFNSNAIIQNIKADDVGTFLVSSAACKLTGITFLSGIPGPNELAAGKLIFKLLHQFKTESEDLYNSFHETYTNDHITFHACLKNPSFGKYLATKNAFTKYRDIFEQCTKESYPNTWRKAIKRNPFVSFACHATHALKYGMGQKSFTGGDKVKLCPNYDQNGTPSNKYLGKLYIAILSPNDIKDLTPTFVIDKHANNKITINTHNQNNILIENEVSFFGYLPEGLIKHSSVLEIPELDPETKYDYVAINSNFSKATGKANEIIKERSPTFEAEAGKLIKNLECLRTYPNVFEGDYTDNPEDSEKIRVAQWLNSINNKPIITSSPMKAIGSATNVSIGILAKCLQLQPTNLSVISMSFCNLENSGAFFSQILRNNKVPLQELTLRSCKLTEIDTQTIARSLRDSFSSSGMTKVLGNKSLRTLILDGNNVGQQANEFATTLKANTTLTYLSLYHTKIPNIQCFCDLFPNGGHKESLNKSLTVLNLEFYFDQKLLNTIQKGLYRNLKECHLSHKVQSTINKGDNEESVDLHINNLSEKNINFSLKEVMINQCINEYKVITNKMSWEELTRVCLRINTLYNKHQQENKRNNTEGGGCNKVLACWLMSQTVLNWARNWPHSVPILGNPTWEQVLKLKAALKEDVLENMEMYKELYRQTHPLWNEFNKIMIVEEEEKSLQLNNVLSKLETS